MNEVVEEFTNRFNKAISNRGMKPSELSEKTGISKSTISHYMSGYTKPKSDKLFVLAKALEVDEAWLMGLDVPMERNASMSSEKAFLSYLESLGYHLYLDDPEHLPFMSTNGLSCRLKYGTLDSLKSGIDNFVKATVDSELLALKENELKQERLEKERLVKHLQGENIYSHSQFERDKKAYLEANAAHQRTDLSKDELNDKARNKHDDDIMDDPNF